MSPPPTAGPAAGPAWSWTYASLTEALRDRRILLRVYTSPISPLPGPHNDPSTSGFTARNVAFRGLDPRQYASTTAGLKGDKGWADGPYMRPIIVDHVNNRIPMVRSIIVSSLSRGGRGRGPASGRGGQQEVDQTPWISTTGSLDWAIWYIARLLSRGSKEVHLTIINNSRKSWKDGELRVSPFLNRPRSEWQDLAQISKGKYLRASMGAGRAREVLFYGRIFGESLLADLTFTPRELPFALPLCFWNAAHQAGEQGWLSRLRWMPQHAPVEMALANIRQPPPPRTTWSLQPVNSALQTHAARQRFPIAGVDKEVQRPEENEEDEDVEMQSVYSSAVGEEVEEAEAMLIDVV